jgi:penicillin V acylase-like amidase (Ntn superfamily)
MPLRALTNNTYAASEAFARRAAGRNELPAGSASLARFARAAELCTRYEASSAAVDHAFAILSDVAQGGYTKWSIVYDVGAMRVHFRTHRAPDVRWLDLSACDFDCGSPVQTVDMNAPHVGDLAPRLARYARSANLALIATAFGQTDFLRDTPRAALEDLSRYPDETVCGD